MNGPQLAVGVLGTTNTRIFRCYSPGNVPTGAEAFPKLFRASAPLPKAVQPMVSYLRSAFNSLVHLEEHGRVFTAGPAPANPYTIQFSRYYQDYSTLTVGLQGDMLMVWTRNKNPALLLYVLQRKRKRLSPKFEPTMALIRIMRPYGLRCEQRNGRCNGYGLKPQTPNRCL